MTAVRILFFGSPAFAVPTLRALVESTHPVVGVVTQPDRPRGRGQQVTRGAVAAAADALGLPVVQPARLADPGVRELLAAFHADLGVVAAYGKILPGWLLALPSRGMVNVHASLLPKYRGAAPVHRAVMAGERESGVTIMRVVQALDAGPMIDRAVVPIAPDQTSAGLEAEIGAVGATLLVQSVDRLAAGLVVETPQDDAAATYAAKITRADSPVDWTRPAQSIHDQIRGLHPWPHASSRLAGKRVILHRSQRLDGAHSAPAGTVHGASAAGLDVVAGDGAVVRLLELQAEGGRRLTAAQFLAGYDAAAGREVRGLVIAPARRAAFDALGAVASGRTDLDSAVESARRLVTDARDLALLRELVTGTLRWQGAIDGVLAPLCRVSLARLDREVLTSLRLGAYQLLYLDRVPASAVVDDAVALVRAAKKASATGLVNALLRKIARGERGTPPPDSDAAETLARVASHPAWLVRRWLARRPRAEVEAWLAFNNTPAPMTLRVNPLVSPDRAAVAAALARFGVVTEPCRYAPLGLVVREGNPLGTPPYADGSCLVQDEGSQLAALVAPVAPGGRVLDVCGSPWRQDPALCGHQRGRRPGRGRRRARPPRPAAGRDGGTRPRAEHRRRAPRRGGAAPLPRGVRRRGRRRAVQRPGHAAPRSRHQVAADSGRPRPPRGAPARSAAPGQCGGAAGRLSGLHHLFERARRERRRRGPVPGRGPGLLAAPRRRRPRRRGAGRASPAPTASSSPTRSGMAWSATSGRCSSAPRVDRRQTLLYSDRIAHGPSRTSMECRPAAAHHGRPGGDLPGVCRGRRAGGRAGA